MSGGPDKPKPTAKEKALAERAAQDWNRYQQLFKPVENALISDIRATEDKGDLVRGMAATNVGLKSTNVLDQLSGGIQGQGGHGLKALTGMAATQGRAKGLGVAGAQQALETRELQGLVNMAGVGRNLGAMSMQSLGQAASNAARREIQDAQFKNRIDAGYGQMVGDVVGYGIGKGMFGGGGS